MDTEKSQDLRIIQRPARYTGGEWNSVVKSGPLSSRILLAFPDAYEIGTSHLGLRILYSLVNGCEDLAAERTFAPWLDRETQMRAAGEPLRSLESGQAATEFDLIGFSLQHELNYTNMLTMLDLAGLPLRACDRDDAHPLVIAGGPAAFNPEPVAPFIDLFLVGDAEDQLPKLMRNHAELKESGVGKLQILKELSSLQGVYAPALYETEIDPRSGYVIARPPDGERPFVQKALVENLDDFPFPAETIVPFCEIVHDRAAIELARGCSRGCRFCQAGVIYMPERERNPQSVAETVLRMLAATGYGDVGLSSLTPNDYSGLQELVRVLMSRLTEEGISLSLASLSPAGLDRELLRLIKEVRKTGLTIAPEAGTQRLRDVINKGISGEEILAAVSTAFELGWQLIKLYFMIGLPTETVEDVEAIAETAVSVSRLSRRAKITAAISNFVPKPHTPFQWAAMPTAEELRDKQKSVLSAVRRHKRVGIKFHDIDTSLLEGLLSRGDRRVGDAIEVAWRLGCRFDSWGDKLRLENWRSAIEESNLDPDQYLHHAIPVDAVLPWSHIDTGVGIGFLKSEFRKALEGEPSPRCTPGNCPDCGACPPELLRNRWKEKPAEKIELPSPITVNDKSPVRWRMRYSKLGTLKLLSHLDMVRLVARVFRRAGMRVVQSRGFHPQPRISFGPALPLGVQGESEYLDVLLASDVEQKELLARLNEASPQGLVFSFAVRIERSAPSLSKALVAAGYRISRTDNGSFPDGAVERLLSCDRLDWTRRTKNGEQSIDLRPSIIRAESLPPGGEIRLILSLEAAPGRPIARPLEVMQAAFSLDFNQIEVVREQLFVRREGGLAPPIMDTEQECQRK